MVADEDVAACLAMGRYGADLIPAQAILLTHCNAGALATAGWAADWHRSTWPIKSGKLLHVFVDETRPILQGARLTAWELQQAGHSTDTDYGQHGGPLYAPRRDSTRLCRRGPRGC